MHVLCEAIRKRKMGFVSKPPIEHGVPRKVLVSFVAENKSCCLTINAKRNGTDKTPSLYVYIPSMLTGSRCRYITMKSRYGVGWSFCNFICEKLRQSLQKCDTITSVRFWCQNCGEWKNQVETEWDRNLQQSYVGKKRSRSTSDSPMCRIRRPRLKSTISIPVHGFRCSGQVHTPAIRIKKSSRMGIPFLEICLPRIIFGGKNPKRKSLTATFGHDKRWSQFVEDHIGAIVNEWVSIDDALKWYNERDFVHHLKRSFIKVTKELSC